MSSIVSKCITKNWIGRFFGRYLFFFQLGFPFCISILKHHPFVKYPLYMVASENGGTPKWMIYNGKPLFKWMIWGYHYFWKHPYTNGTSPINPPAEGGAQDSTEDLSRCGAEGRWSGWFQSKPMGYPFGISWDGGFDTVTEPDVFWGTPKTGRFSDIDI